MHPSMTRRELACIFTMHTFPDPSNLLPISASEHVQVIAHFDSSWVILGEFFQARAQSLLLVLRVGP